MGDGEGAVSDPIEMIALKAVLHRLITEQSEGEWSDETIARDVDKFADALWPMMFNAKVALREGMGDGE